MTFFAEFAAASIFAYFIVFCRVGGLMMMMPGIGEDFIFARARLALALLVSAIMAPLVAATLPPEPPSPTGLFMIIVQETAIGVTVGLAARLLMGALNWAGAVIAAQAGLSFATMADPTQGSQGAAVGAMLSLLGLVLIFVTDTHILMFKALVDSYELFKPTALPPLGDFSDLVLRLITYSFFLGIQLSAPFIIYGIVVNIGLGLLNKLMPSMQVFFIILPIQIALAFLAFAATLTPAMTWFLTAFEARMAEFLLAR